MNFNKDVGQMGKVQERFKVIPNLENTSANETVEFFQGAIRKWFNLGLQGGVGLAST